MAVRVVVVASDLAASGKTYFAAGLARWLKTRGYSVAPLHLSAPSLDPIDCPGGGRVSHPAALLAEACGLMPSLDFEAGWDAIPSLLQEHDLVIVESPAGPPPPVPAILLKLTRRPTAIDISPGGSLPLFQPGLIPDPDPALAALPPWRLGAGPRVGIISLPHITNFPEYQPFRGAEWIASPPAGRFGVLFLPHSSNPPEDLAWLGDTGLLDWLRRQVLDGARLAASGWPLDALPPVADHLEPGALADYRIASRILQLRMPAPLPSEELLERLADWAGQWTGLEDLAVKLM